LFFFEKANTLKKHIFGFLLFFLLFFIFSKINCNICPHFTMLTKQNLNVLHSKLVKKKCLPDLLGDPSIQRLCFFFFLENDHIIMDDLPIFKIKWSIFMGHRFISKTDMFSQVTYPFWHSKIYLFSRPTYFFFQISKRTLVSVHTSLKLVYFHEQLTILKFQKEFQQAFMLFYNWSIFTCDLSF
jgi:hypothetical protein